MQFVFNSTSLKRCAALILPLTLIGCGGGSSAPAVSNTSSHAVLGPLSGAEIRAYRLSNLNNPVEGPVTSNTSLTDLSVAGTFILPLSGIADDDWVLVTATGGQDIDANDDGVVGPSVILNSGVVHSLATAAEWRSGKPNVSTLTEIAWHYAQDVLPSPASLEQRLDALAVFLITQDLNNDGVIDRKDITAFKPVQHAQHTSFNYQSLLPDDDGTQMSLVELIHAGQDAADLTALLEEQLGTRLWIEPENLPPNVSVGNDQVVTEQSRVVLTGSASDSDGTLISYDWSQISGSPVVITNANQLNASFTAPTITNAEILVFQLLVIDNEGGRATDSVSIAVSPVNALPLANAGADQAVNEQSLVGLDGSGTDSDGFISGYHWTQISGTPMLLADANNSRTVFTSASIAVTEMLTFQLTVTDNEGGTASDRVSITVNPVRPSSVTVSGTIQAASGSFIDSDVNDPDAPYQSNSNPQEAQEIPSPAVVGGYASALGTGSLGDRFESEGDLFDSYAVFLAAGQTASLIIADYSSQNPTEIDLDLWLYPAADSSTPVADSLSISETESVQAPYTGNFHVVIEAYRGHSNYVLTVGQSPLQAASAGHRISSADEFVTGELIVEMGDPQREVKGDLSAQRRQALSDRISAMGLNTKAGEVGRALLLGLGDSQQRQAALAALQPENSSVQSRVWGFGSKRDKIETIRAMKSLQAQQDVAAAGLNYIRRPQARPNDTYYPLQWHYPLINLPQAWDVATGNNVIVAVIDTGVYMAHPDLVANLTSTGYDFIRSVSRSNDGDGIDSNPDDPGDGIVAGESIYHGTHVAGTIAATTNNNEGVAGVAWDAKIMPIRVLGQGGGETYDLIQGIRYAAGLSNDSGTVPSSAADIINMSLGGPGFSQLVQNTINEARAAGTIIIAAAGNDGSSTPQYPAAYDGVVSVSAVRFDKALTRYSSYGNSIDLAAPGGDMAVDQNLDSYPDGVLSTVADDSSGVRQHKSTLMSGTSMAAPHVAGVAALMKSVYPGLTSADFDNAIISGQITEDLGGDGPTARNNQYGYGLIDGLKAVRYADALASGTPLPAIISVDRTTLDFGSVLVEQTITISNAGGVALFITSVVGDASWLSVTAGILDSNNLGEYKIRVDRSGLSAGVYRGNISVYSDSIGSLSIPVTLGVAGAITTSADVGYQWVLLLDADSLETAAAVGVQATDGRYSYSFAGVVPGDYFILSGTDSDHDLYVCDAGESCGGYPLLTNMQAQTIVEDITDLDFTSNFRVGFSSLSAAGTDGLDTRPRKKTEELGR